MNWSTKNMETDLLVSLLARGVTPVDRHVVARRLGWALLAAALGATLLVVTFYGIRPDIGTVSATPIFWAKVALPVALAAGALAVTIRLARPGARVGLAWAGIGIPIAAVWLAGLIVVLLAPEGARVALVMGETWRSCPFNIAFLSIPGFVASFAAVRGLAPTNLRLAGATTGLLAGATATIAYCLHCPEMSAAFWALWYVLGMLVPTVAGALLGPKWLHW